MGTEHSPHDDAGASLEEPAATGESAIGDVLIPIDEASSVPARFEVPSRPLSSRLELGGASAEEDETTSPGVPAFRLPEDEEAPKPRSIVPRPEGYRGSVRSSAPPPKPPPSGRLLRRDDGPRFDLGAHPANVPASMPPASSSNGTALQPMRMIEVKGDYGAPAAGSAEPFGEITVSETPDLPPVAPRAPADPPSRSRLSEPPPLPGSLQPPAFQPPAAFQQRVEPPMPSTPRVEPPMPSAPRVEPPLPSTPRAEPPLPPGAQAVRRVSVEPPAQSSPNPVSPGAFGSGAAPYGFVSSPIAAEPPLPSSPRSAGAEPPPLPGSVPSRPAPGRIPSRNPRSPSGEPPPLPRQPTSSPAPASGQARGQVDDGLGADGPAQTLRTSGITGATAEAAALPRMGAPGAAKFGDNPEGAEELELESIPPPLVEAHGPEALPLPPERSRAKLPSVVEGEPMDPTVEDLAPISRPGGSRRSFPGASPSAHQMESDAQADENPDVADSTSRSRPRPPAPPSRGRTEGAEVDVEVTVDAPASEAVSDPSADQGRPPPRRRLPRTPPPRTGFTGAPDDDAGKRRHWWDEIFSDDFLRADAELTESQFLAEVNFIQESLGVEKGGLVLDLACGAGRHTIELARRGYTAVGYDLSLSQLARAGERAQRIGTKVSFLHGDMRELAFEPTFDGIFCWNAGFGYFEEEKNQAVLRNVFRALKPGGSFLLDIPNRDFVVSQQPNQNWFEGDGCVCMDDMQVDFITSRLVVKRTIMLDDGRNRECVYSIRLYGLHELGRMLHDAGFRVAEVTGHIAMRGVFMGATSPRLILVVTKP